MEYRIRYHKQSQSGPEQETLVQANSPAEAMVKFLHTRGDSRDTRQNPWVTSVCPEPATGEPNW
ncbi:MAG: hypothetical protein EHM48_01660 [Planctomycetaceae bacterium]|nr:MAG: hypothetical protein EHM48_01660 [Planctomycetaceae bacterium]